MLKHVPKCDQFDEAVTMVIENITYMPPTSEGNDYTMGDLACTPVSSNSLGLNALTTCMHATYRNRRRVPTRVPLISKHDYIFFEEATRTLFTQVESIRMTSPG